MPITEPDLGRSWLFGTAADARAPQAMLRRALVDGLWVEVPTYRNARRLLERGARLGARH